MQRPFNQLTQFFLLIAFAKLKSALEVFKFLGVVGCVAIFLVFVFLAFVYLVFYALNNGRRHFSTKQFVLVWFSDPRLCYINNSADSPSVGFCLRLSENIADRQVPNMGPVPVFTSSGTRSCPVAVVAKWLCHHHGQVKKP